MKFLCVFAVFFALAFGLDLNNLEMNFSQNVTNEDNQTISYKGKVYVKDKLVLWDYQSPSAKRVILKQDLVYVFEPLLEQVSISSVKKGLNLADIYKKAKQIKPFVKEASIEKQKFLITDNGKFLTQISYKDEINNDTQINFSFQKHRVLEDLLFDVTIPKNFDVIRQD